MIGDCEIIFVSNAPTVPTLHDALVIFTEIIAGCLRNLILLSVAFYYVFPIKDINFSFGVGHIHMVIPFVCRGIHHEADMVNALPIIQHRCGSFVCRMIACSPIPIARAADEVTVICLKLNHRAAGRESIPGGRIIITDTAILDISTCQDIKF